MSPTDAPGIQLESILFFETDMSVYEIMNAQEETSYHCSAVRMCGGAACSPAQTRGQDGGVTSALFLYSTRPCAPVRRWNDPPRCVSGKCSLLHSVYLSKKYTVNYISQDALFSARPMLPVPNTDEEFALWRCLVDINGTTRFTSQHRSKQFST